MKINIERKKVDKKEPPPKWYYPWLNYLIVLGFLGNMGVFYYDEFSSRETKNRDMEVINKDKEAMKEAKTSSDLAKASSDSMLRIYGPISDKLRHLYPNETESNAFKKVMARLDSLRPTPLPTRLRNLLNEINPKILLALRGGQTEFGLNIPTSQYTRLMEMRREKGANEFIQIVDRHNVIIGSEGGEETHNASFILKPKLLQP